MKIFHVITTIERGGAENQLTILAEEQIRKGHRVTVIPLKGSCDLLSRFQKMGADVNITLLNKNLIVKIIYFIQLKLFSKPDLVHAHLPEAELISAATKFRIPLVVSRHNAEQFAPRYPRFISLFLSRFVDLKADSVISISIAVADYLKSHKEVRRTRIINVVHYGYDPNFNTSILNRNDKKNDEILRIITIGRLVEQKDYPTLLYAIKHCVDKGINLRVIIIGDGILRKKLLELCDDLDLDNFVTFLGKKEDIFSLLIRNDIFILSSQYEGFGLVLLEALQAKIPILASNNSAIPEVLGENYSGLFETSNHDQLSQLILRAKDGKFREMLRFELSSRLDFFKPEDMSNRILNIYSSLLKKAS